MKWAATGLILAMLLSVLTGAGASAAEPATGLASVSSGGASADGDSFWPALTADGRYVAFMSNATNLVSGDTNGRSDIFVRDRSTGQTELASVAAGGSPANGDSNYPSISADGRYVAFVSYATNLIPGGTDGRANVFVRDRVGHTTELVSAGLGGAPADANSNASALSADGRYVAFDSSATNLVAGDTNGRADVFVRDRLAGTTERVSVSSGGAVGNGDSSWPSISANGRHVAFQSSAPNLVASDTNYALDVFVHDRQSHTTERVSVSSSGEQGIGTSERASLSGDGRYVAFQSRAANLVPGDTNGSRDVFVHDRQTHITERVSVSGGGQQGSGSSERPALSADGRYVAFHSTAPDLVGGDSNGKADIFVRDRQTGATERASVSSTGEQGNGESYCPSLSGDGRYVAFYTYSSNLVVRDYRNSSAVLVRDRGDQDTIPPATTATLSGTAGSNGWYLSPVVVALAATDQGGSGVREIAYSASGAQNVALTTVSGATASVTIANEGTTTLTYYATDGSGNVEAPKTVAVRIDRTAPVVTFSGNAGSYGVDQTIDIGCSASDNVSGVASSSCQKLSGPAYSFPLGANSLSATAMDKAGNAGSGTTRFTVQATYASLGSLVKRFAANPGVAQSLVAKLQAAERAIGRDNAEAEEGTLSAFVEEVRAQSGKALAAEDAATLILLAGGLQPQ